MLSTRRVARRAPAVTATSGCEEDEVQDLDWGEPDEAPDDRAQGRRRPVVLFVLASLPWLLVVALLVLPGRRESGDARGVAVADPTTATSAEATTADTGTTPAGGEGPAGTPPPAPPEATSPAAADTESPIGGAGPDADAASALTVTELQGRWRSVAGEEEAVSLALVTARAWLTGVAPVLAVGDLRPPRPDGYAEHLVVEAVERPEPGALVVTLLAVVLDTSTDEARAEVRRVAVGIAETAAGPRVAGSPWELAPPVLGMAALDREPMTDAADLDAARHALRAAGLDTLEPVALYATEHWPVVAEVVARGGDDDGRTSSEPGVREVWLRRHLDGFAVAGAPLHRPPSDVADGAAPHDAGAEADAAARPDEQERP